jgi:hypothetical protein
MGRPVGSKNKKSIWLLQSLANNGYDYEKMLTKFLSEAARGNQRSYAMAQLLVKMVPYLANMPKTDGGVLAIETLVINRYAGVQPSIAEPIDTDAIADDGDATPEGPDTAPEGIPPLSPATHPINNP